MQLTPEHIDRVEDKKLANVLRKVYAGKSLTAREEVLWEREKAKVRDAAGGDVQTPAAVTSAYAKTWDELAAACSVDRRTLTNARTNFGKECPKDRADGRKDIAAWLAFLDEKGVRGRGVNNPDIDYIDERQLRLRRERVQLAKAEYDLEKAVESMLPVVDFEAALSRTVGAFVTTINQVPGRASQKIVARARIAVLDMLRGALTEKEFAKVEPILDSAQIEYGEIQQIIDYELQHARQVLAQCDYLNSPAEAPVDAMPAACPSPTKPPASSGASSKPCSRRRRAKSSGRSSKK